MNHIRRILAAVATLAGALLALAAAPAAWAELPPYGGGPASTHERSASLPRAACPAGRPP